MNVKIAPSLMCMSLARFSEQIAFMNQAADFLHIDIMDGHYVRNFALSTYFMTEVAALSRVPMDTHLMVTEPTHFLAAMAKAGAQWISPHAETINRDAFRVIGNIRDLGCRPGLVLNPATPIDAVKHYLHLVDKLTILTVDPGYAGQKFIPEMIEKIADARRFRDDKGANFLIEIDGSCNKRTYENLLRAGADVLIVGTSGLFSLNPDIATAWTEMRGDVERAEASLARPA
ncbi:MAG: D-allulose 6-phosphate 3-epimerase [Azospirillaceae bacterium]|nr:D-allulose 6-phosphate 3-epimerase [Azospirillaceae bacterium]